MPANSTLKEDVIQQQILQAARQLFQKHGYQKVTMDDVARAIGKGRSSLYYYYKNKDEVFDAVMDAEIDDIISDITRIVEQALTVGQKLHAFILAKIKISRKRKSFFDALETGMNADEISQYAQRKQVIQKKIRKEETILLDHILTKGAETGEIKTLAPREKDTVIFVLMGSQRGLSREMLLENSYAARMEPAVDMLVRMTMLTISL